MTAIDVETLKAAAEKIFDRLEQMDIKTIELDEDAYWMIPTRQKYDSFQRPNELRTGSLEIDLENIERIASGEDEPNGYGLIWLAALYRYVGENVIT